MRMCKAVVLDGGARADAEAAAQRLQWPLQSHFEHCDAALVCDEKGYALWARDVGLLHLDYLGGREAWRMAHQQGRNELLIKAICGSQTLARRLQSSPRILDATAGFGRDALVLMNAGFQVTLFEREWPVMLLLQQALARLQQVYPLMVPSAVCQQDITLITGNNGDVARFDIVYCDPMFPERDKSALVKKEGRLLQAFAQPGDDAALLEAALRFARDKVVVKRPLKAATLTGASPSYSVCGKAIRYDVYAVPSAQLT